MRLHGYRMPYQPQYGTTGGAEVFPSGPNEIWSYGDEVYEICKKYIELRAVCVLISELLWKLLMKRELL